MELTHFFKKTGKGSGNLCVYSTEISSLSIVRQNIAPRQMALQTKEFQKQFNPHWGEIRFSELNHRFQPRKGITSAKMSMIFCAHSSGIIGDYYF